DAAERRVAALAGAVLVVVALQTGGAPDAARLAAIDIDLEVAEHAVAARGRRAHVVGAGCTLAVLADVARALTRTRLAASAAVDPGLVAVEHAIEARVDNRGEWAVGLARAWREVKLEGERQHVDTSEGDVGGEQRLDQRVGRQLLVRDDAVAI